MKTFIDKILPNYDPKKLLVTHIPYGAPYLKIYQVGDMYCFGDEMIDPDTGKKRMPYPKAMEHARKTIYDGRKGIEWTTGEKLT